MGRIAALLLALLLSTLVGCGSDDDAPPAAAPAGDWDSAAEKRAPDVTLSGGERLLFFGDSLSVEGAVTFAERLPDALEPEAEGVRVENVSVPGTTSADWRPGAELFERELKPRLDRADVVLVSVGGNDLQGALGAADGPGAASEAAAAAALPKLRAALRRIRRNLDATFEASRATNPKTAIVYVGYPDYSRSSIWREVTGGFGAIAFRAGLGRLLEASSAAGPDAVVDMLEATGADDLDALLADAEHLSEQGHELYAKEIAAALTG